MALRTCVFLLLTCTSLAKPVIRRRTYPRHFQNNSLLGITETSFADEITSTITAISPEKTCVAIIEVIPGETCSDVANPHGIPLSAYEASSPADSAACQDLLSGYLICVAASTTSVPSTTSPTTDTTLPGPESTIETSPTPTSLSTWSSIGITELTYTIGTSSSTGVRTITITRTSTEVVTLTRTMNLTTASSWASNSSYPFANASIVLATGSSAFTRVIGSLPSPSPPSVFTSSLLPSSTLTSSSSAASATSLSDWSSSATSDSGITSSISFQEITSQSSSSSALTLSSSTLTLTSSSPTLTLTPSSSTSALIPNSQTTTFTSTSTSSLTYTITSSPAAAATASGVDVYRMYSGDGSIAAGWPAQSQWVDFDYMFTANTPNMLASCAQWGVPDNSATELADLKTAIQTIAAASSVDPRFILAIIMQESTGCVRVITTAYSVFNPGLMQSHNGMGTCNTNNAPLGIPGVVATGVVQDPCPYAAIQQQVQDGTQGTSSGDGLQQCWEKQGHTDVSGWYRAARMYNGGSIDASGDLGMGCCTACYASDVANRLTGWVDAPHRCSL